MTNTYDQETARTDTGHEGKADVVRYADGKHYPLPMRKWQSVADEYLNSLPEGVFSIGRAGSYRYEVDIDDCIEQSMEVAEKLL